MNHGRTSATPRLTRLGEVRFFEHVFRDAGVGVIVTNLDRTITHANPLAERMHGWGPGELVGRSLADLAAPGQPPITLEQVEAANGWWNGHVLNRRKSGAVLPVRLTITVLRDDAGEVVGRIGILADDTEHQRRRLRLRSLVRLGAALNAESDLSTLLSRICRETREVFAVDGVYLARWDERAQELVGVAGDGALADEVGQHRSPLRDRDDALGQVLRERRPVYVNDIRPEGEHAEVVEHFQLRSVLLVPLVRGDRLLGLLSLNDTRRPDRFGPGDVDHAQAFAELAAVALDNARVHEAERVKAERLLGLAEIGQLLTASLEREQVLEAIVRGARRLLGVDDVRIWILERPHGPFRLAHFDPPGEGISRELDIDHSLTGQVVRTRQPWQTSDIRADAGGRFHYTLGKGLRGCLIVPLLARDVPVGSMSFFTTEVRAFDDDEVQLATIFGHQAAIAIQNAETLTRERQAQGFEQLVQRAKGLEPADRAHVEALLATAARFIELASRPELR